MCVFASKIKAEIPSCEIYHCLFSLLPLITNTTAIYEITFLAFAKELLHAHVISWYLCPLISLLLAIILPFSIFHCSSFGLLLFPFLYVEQNLSSWWKPVACEMLLRTKEVEAQLLQTKRYIWCLKKNSNNECA